MNYGQIMNQTSCSLPVSCPLPILVLEENRVEQLHVADWARRNGLTYDLADDLVQGIGYLRTRTYRLVLADTGSSLLGPQVIAEAACRSAHRPMVVALAQGESDAWYWIHDGKKLYDHFFLKKDLSPLEGILKRMFS